MKIALCIKQVPDTADIKWTENNTIQREGVESIINPFDSYAIETAVRLKEKIKNLYKLSDKAFNILSIISSAKNCAEDRDCSIKFVNKSNMYELKSILQLISEGKTMKQLIKELLTQETIVQTSIYKPS